MSTQSQIIRIDRSTPFNPVALLGAGWSIWRGPWNGTGLIGAEQNNSESLALTEVDLARIVLKPSLEVGGAIVGGEEFLTQLKNAKSLVLDAKVGQTLYENPHLIPESWKGTWVNFMGTVLRNDRERRHVMCLLWNGRQWRYREFWLDYDFEACRPAAIYE